jgi:hypothetical protein
MSAPNCGFLKAEIYGLPFTFDGRIWTYPEIPSELKDFFRSFVRDLNSDFARRGIMHHTSLRMRAEMMLTYAVPEGEGKGWVIVEEVPDPSWSKPLPEGAKD